MHANIYSLEFMNFMLFLNKVNKVQAKNKVKKVRTSQLWLYDVLKNSPPTFYVSVSNVEALLYMLWLLQQSPSWNSRTTRHAGNLHSLAETSPNAEVYKTCIVQQNGENIEHMFQAV